MAVIGGAVDDARRAATWRGSAEMPAQALVGGVVDGVPIVETKLAPPRRRSGLVARPRILRSLDASESAAFTLVSAPTGYGKTTAVVDWCTSRSTPFVWVTLDAGDNDPARLWTYVATAIDRLRAGLARRTLQRLAVSQADVRPALDVLANSIAAHPEPIVVVLDDLHLITDLDVISTSTIWSSGFRGTRDSLRSPASTRRCGLPGCGRAERCLRSGHPTHSPAPKPPGCWWSWKASRSARPRWRLWWSAQRDGPLASIWPLCRCASIRMFTLG